MAKSGLRLLLIFSVLPCYNRKRIAAVLGACLCLLIMDDAGLIKYIRTTCISKGGDTLGILIWQSFQFAKIIKCATIVNVIFTHDFDCRVQSCDQKLQNWYITEPYLTCQNSAIKFAGDLRQSPRVPVVVIAFAFHLRSNSQWSAYNIT